MELASGLDGWCGDHTNKVWWSHWHHSASRQVQQGAKRGQGSRNAGMFAHWFDMCTVQIDDSYDPQALAYCQQLPKIELHAHLNGSVRDETIRQLVEEKGISRQDLDDITSKKHRTLEDCFRLFDIIHQCTSDHASITRITQEVIHDFAMDKVFYLELRTTPKDRPQQGMTKASYAAAVLQGMQLAQQQLQAEGRCMMVRLMLSIDRRESAEAGLDTVRLAISLRDQGVVGIDLSGNPRAGHWKLWEPAMQEARAAGLHITLHAGELTDAAHLTEVAEMLRFPPDRLGHMCCMDAALEQQLLATDIPVELCLTSNIKTCTFSGYTDHHFCGLYAAKHPVVLCTDDAGVFGTTLSKELAIAMTTFKLTGAQMQQLTLAAVDHTFLPAADKEVLRKKMQEAIEAVKLPDLALADGGALN